MQGCQIDLKQQEIDEKKLALEAILPTSSHFLKG